jgi:hypothetical protein
MNHHPTRPPVLTERSGGTAPGSVVREQSIVVFSRPFTLGGIEGSFPAGSYQVTEERVALDVPWPAYRTATRILIRTGNVVQSWPTTRAELDAALLCDSAE